MKATPLMMILGHLGPQQHCGSDVHKEMKPPIDMTQKQGGV